MNFLSRDFEMSLAYFIVNGFQANPDYYGCENFELRPPSVKRELWGAYFFVSGVLILALYSICFIAIATHDLMKTPAYKAMIILGIYDILSILVGSIATGIMGFYGVTFCDAPLLIIVLGSIGYGAWLGCCITSFTLAVIRVLEVCDSSLAKIFDGRRIYYWLGLFTMYGFLGTFLSKPIIFSPTLMTWLFDPLVGKDPELYINYSHTVNNTFLVCGTFMLYFYLGYLFVKKSNTIGVNQISKYQIRILLQAFFFCIFHLISAILFVYMNNVAAPEFLILTGQITWQFGTGAVLQNPCTPRGQKNCTIRIVHEEYTVPIFLEIAI